MNNKYLFSITFLVVISLVCLVSALKFLATKQAQEVLGTYTFANTKDNLFKLGRIELINDNAEEINLYYDGAWRFEEAADYYAAENSIRSFFEVVNNSVLIENIEASEAKGNFIHIKTYDTSDNLLDDVYFSNNDSGMVKYAGKNNLYKATKINLIPINSENWIPFPLLSVEEKLISAVNVDGHYAKIEQLNEIRAFDDNINVFLMAFENVNYGGIIDKDLFFEEYADADMKEIKLYLFGGLNYRLQVFNTRDGYYVRIIPERELIAQIEVNKIIEIKKLYYDNWLFLLDEGVGEFLYNFKLDETEK